MINYVYIAILIYQLVILGLSMGMYALLKGIVFTCSCLFFLSLLLILCSDTETRKLCDEAIQNKWSLPLYVLDFNKQYRTEALYRWFGLLKGELRDGGLGDGSMSQRIIDKIRFILQVGADVDGIYHHDGTFMDFIAHQLVNHYNYKLETFIFYRGGLSSEEEIERLKKWSDPYMSVLVDILCLLVSSGSKSVASSKLAAGSKLVGSDRDYCSLFNKEGRCVVDEIHYYLVEKNMIMQAIVWAKYFSLDFFDQADSVLLQGQAFVVKQCMTTLMLCWHRAANKKTGGIAYLLSFFEPKKISYPKPEKDVGEMIYYYALRSYGFPRDKCTKEITGVAFTF